MHVSSVDKELFVLLVSRVKGSLVVEMLLKVVQLVKNSA